MPEGRSDKGNARARGTKNREAPLPFLLAILGWTPRDAVAFVVGIVALIAILVNCLSLQSGLHPAPLFPPAEVEKTAQPAAKRRKPIITVQRALSEFGYGQIKSTGTLFERQRNLLITGRLSEQLVRELSAVTGRMLE